MRVRKENAGRNRDAKRRVETGPVDRSKTILPASHVVTKFIPRKHGLPPFLHPAFPFNQQGYIVEEIKADGMM